MTRMFSIIFVILFFFIMVLCAVQPICFSNALEGNQFYTLSVEETELNYKAVYLMLDKDTPLTLGYLRDNPDYKVYITPSGGNTTICAVFPNGSTGSIVNTSSSGTIPYIITYNSYIQNLHDRYGDLIWDYPVELRNNASEPSVLVFASKNYELSLLEKLYLISTHIITGASAVVNTIVKSPLMLISCGLSLLAVVIVMFRRVLTAG